VRPTLRYGGLSSREILEGRLFLGFAQASVLTSALLTRGVKVQLLEQSPHAAGNRSLQQHREGLLLQEMGNLELPFNHPENRESVRLLTEDEPAAENSDPTAARMHSLLHFLATTAP
jgi:hypothetical protein